MKGPFPAKRLNAVVVEVRLPPNYRIFPSAHKATPLGGVPGDSRFCTKAAGYAVLYTADDFLTAFVETVVRDRFTSKAKRQIYYKEVAARSWSKVYTKKKKNLKLVDLRGDGCTVLGTSTDAVNARSHRSGRALAMRIHKHHPSIDGILFSSRLTGQDVYAIFDRATPVLTAKKAEPVKNHPDLASILSRYGISLIV